MDWDHGDTLRHRPVLIGGCRGLPALQVRGVVLQQRSQRGGRQRVRCLLLFLARLWSFRDDVLHNRFAFAALVLGTFLARGGAKVRHEVRARDGSDEAVDDHFLSIPRKQHQRVTQALHELRVRSIVAIRCVVGLPRSVSAGEMREMGRKIRVLDEHIVEVVCRLILEGREERIDELKIGPLRRGRRLSHNALGHRYTGQRRNWERDHLIELHGTEHFVRPNLIGTVDARGQRSGLDLHRDLFALVPRRGSRVVVAVLLLEADFLYHRGKLVNVLRHLLDSHLEMLDLRCGVAVNLIRALRDLRLRRRANRNGSRGGHSAAFFRGALRPLDQSQEVRLAPLEVLVLEAPVVRRFLLDLRINSKRVMVLDLTEAVEVQLL
jgi:hypothetical protein